MRLQYIPGTCMRSAPSCKPHSTIFFAHVSAKPTTGGLQEGIQYNYSVFILSVLNLLKTKTPNEAESLIKEGLYDVSKLCFSVQLSGSTVLYGQ